MKQTSGLFKRPVNKRQIQRSTDDAAEPGSAVVTDPVTDAVAKVLCCVVQRAILVRLF